MNRERVEAVVRENCPDWWDQRDVIDIASNAIDAPDRALIAHDFWALGATGDHPECPYANGESDADYENACEACEARLLMIADLVVAAVLSTGQGEQA